MAWAFTDLLGSHLRRSARDDCANGRTGRERVQTSIALAGKVVVALYIPGPPSRNIAPLTQLLSAYESTVQEKSLEVVYVPPPGQSSGFLECERQGLKLELANKFGIEDFPSLVFMDAGAKVIETDGLVRLARDPLLKDFPWPAPAEQTALLGPQLSHSDQHKRSSKRPLEVAALPPQVRRCLDTKEQNENHLLLGSISSLSAAAPDAQSTASTAVQQMAVVSASSLPVRSQTRELRAFVDHSPSARGTQVPPLMPPREWRKLKRKLLKKTLPNGATFEWFGTAPSLPVGESSLSK